MEYGLSYLVLFFFVAFWLFGFLANIRCVCLT